MTWILASFKFACMFWKSVLFWQLKHPLFSKHPIHSYTQMCVENNRESVLQVISIDLLFLRDAFCNNSECASGNKWCLMRWMVTQSCQEFSIVLLKQVKYIFLYSKYHLDKYGSFFLQFHVSQFCLLSSQFLEISQDIKSELWDVNWELREKHNCEINSNNYLFLFFRPWHPFKLTLYIL